MEFACNNNYTLAGKRKITCEETKDWSSPIPRCWGELYFMLTVILRPNLFLSCNLEVNELLAICELKTRSGECSGESTNPRMRGSRVTVVLLFLPFVLSYLLLTSICNS